MIFRVLQIEALAHEKGARAAQIALAWLLFRGDEVFPIPGCKSRGHLEENIGALKLVLTSAELATLDRIFPNGTAVGTRYPEDEMKRVNL